MANPSNSYINNPGTQIGHGNQGAGTGAATGAAAGAAAGTAIFPGIGTAIGAVVGGVVGAIAGAFGDKGKMYERKAHKWEKLGKTREAGVQIRDAVDNFRQQRAMQMATIGAESGGTQSSAPMGAVASFGSQYVFGMNFNQGQNYIQGKVQKNMRKAGENYNKSKNTFAYLDAATSIAGSFGGGSFGKQTIPTFGSPSGGNSSPQPFVGPR